ncbi:MAG: tRNA threonylcarbamoyladenosine dehydratase [Acutalibacteraceae bacterium]|nr:tRNA threonylcarbamoyladenosine dehydratase [Acutalibacteraceae bacterium]
MENQYTRTSALLGEDAVNKLKTCRVAVFGVGGVGSYTVEALARAGVGQIDIIDNDIFSITNINRQLYATHKTLGEYKVDVAKDRILDINPDCIVKAHKLFYLPENSEQFDLSVYDYIVDAIDTVAAKVELAVNAQKTDTPIISSMGTGNKLCPEKFEITDIYKTSVCPLAKVMRARLKKAGVKKLKVVYSKEEPTKNQLNIIGSVPFVPSVAGLIIAGEVIKDLINKKEDI